MKSTILITSAAAEAGDQRSILLRKKNILAAYLNIETGGEGVPASMPGNNASLFHSVGDGIPPRWLSLVFKSPVAATEGYDRLLKTLHTPDRSFFTGDFTMDLSF